MPLLRRVESHRLTQGAPAPEAPSGNGRAPRPATTANQPVSAAERAAADYRKLLLDEIDLDELSKLDPTQQRVRLERVMSHLISRQGPVLSTRERQNIIRRVVDEALGLGILEPLLADQSVTEIMVNGPDDIFVERAGKLEKLEYGFSSNDQLMQTIDRIVAGVNRRVDESSPMVDARLPTGERVNVIVPPLALDGAALTIRRFPTPFTMQDLVGKGSFDAATAELLVACVRARLNIVVSGGTGTGKTTLLNALSGQIPDRDRIVTIEDSAELQLQQPHVIRLESRPPNIEGKGQVTIRDLVRNSLRMRPDRIIVGEVRGGETLDMLQAMNTGHDGSLVTVHANSTEDAVSRLETLASMSELKVPYEALRDQINSAVDLIVQLTRGADGSRRVTEIATVTSKRREEFTLRPLMRFEQEPPGPDRVVRGRVRQYEVPAVLADRLWLAGHPLPRHIPVEAGASCRQPGVA
ncbi:CpaF family protein [Sediminivirga luteola]|uniref:Secretion protein n=1 Tax=Sediminivirga luteola TaxID=1774748 RepID=A0A8J2TXR3_9MICO|nr:CpaF family protein [Sediminivirga luteola]MCI2266052.1 CpaF family protein [Sediminivirga luteola]GGA13444.1 secretion protein [Sediminivirga luteola]